MYDAPPCLAGSHTWASSLEIVKDPDKNAVKCVCARLPSLTANPTPIDPSAVIESGHFVPSEAQLPYLTCKFSAKLIVVEKGSIFSVPGTAVVPPDATAVASANKSTSN